MSRFPKKVEYPFKAFICVMACKDFKTCKNSCNLRVKTKVKINQKWLFNFTRQKCNKKRPQTLIMKNRH